MINITPANKLKNKSEKGFTLIELLIACSILGIIFFLIYLTFYNTSQAIDRNKGTLDIYPEARIIFNRMDKEISSAFFSKLNVNINFVGETNTFGENNADTLNFVCTLNPIKKNTHQSELMEIGYYLKTSDTNLGTLIRRSSAEIDDKVEAGGYEQIFGHNIKSLKFRYSDGADWKDTWDSKKMAKLPKMVEISIIFYDEIAKKDYLLSTTISVPLGEMKP